MRARPNAEGAAVEPGVVGRLTRRPDFLAAAKGRRTHSERMTVQGLHRPAEREGVAGLRIGFTITKRVGNAPVRNRIRRRLRAAAAGLGRHAALPADVVVIARRPLLSTPFPELAAELDRAVAAVARPKRPGPEPRSES